MSFYLIDTDIASFIFKGSDYADPYLPYVTGQQLAVRLKFTQPPEEAGLHILLK